jgi:hypothetical protein
LPGYFGLKQRAIQEASGAGILAISALASLRFGDLLLCWSFTRREREGKKILIQPSF